MKRAFPALALALACTSSTSPEYPVWHMNCAADQIHQFQEVQLFSGTGHGDEIYQARFLWCDPPWHMDSLGRLTRITPPTH